MSAKRPMGGRQRATTGARSFPDTEFTMPRPLLTDAQRSALFDHPTTERDLIRYYTLTPAHLALIARQRHDHTRLGFALMLCTLRYPGQGRRMRSRWSSDRSTPAL